MQAPRSNVVSYQLRVGAFFVLCLRFHEIKIEFFFGSFFVILIERVLLSLSLLLPGRGQEKEEEEKKQTVIAKFIHEK